MEEGRSPVEIRELLLTMKRRDDLLAKVATKVDAALKELEEKSALQVRKHNVPQRVDWNAAGLNRPEVSTVATAPSLCPRCQIQVDPESHFCQRCGAPLKMSVDAATDSAGGNHVQKIPGSTTRRYVCKEADTLRLLHDLKSWLGSQGFDTQQMNADDESLLLQIKKRGGWRDLVGMATSLNILFHQADDTLIVEIGAGKWVDKAAVGTVSLFILWPLAITAGMGAWEQMKMPDRIFDFIGGRLACR
jgi:hypothetical protein